VWAQSPAGATRFDIRGFSVLGAPQLASDELSRIAAPFIGRKRTPADVLRAQQALQQAYLDLGDCSTQVWAPKDEPEAGVVTFRLVQTPTPLSRDCVPAVVLDTARAVQPVPVPIAPTLVATRPLAEAIASAAPKSEVAGAAVKPQQDRPAVPPSTAAVQSPITAAQVREVEKPGSAVVANAAKQESASSPPSIAPPESKSIVKQQLVALREAAEPTPQVVAVVLKSGPEPAPQFGKVSPKAELAPKNQVGVISMSGSDVAAPAAVAPPAATASPEPVAPVGEKIAQASAVKPEAKVAATSGRNPANKSVPILVKAPPESAEPVVNAEDAGSAALRFDIARYLIVGNTMLSAAEINQVLRGYTGRQKDFADVQRALESLQTAYSNKGYSAVQVTLPEQELESGEVRFEVIETRLGKIEVQGNELHSERNVRNSVPALREGVTPNSIEIARNLRLANENASKQTQVSLRAGSQDGEVDAMVRLIEDNPVKYTVGMDNTGTYATGKYRTAFGYQNANTLNRDHTLTLQYITSPEHPSAVTVLGLGYRVPLYRSGNSIDFIAGYSDVASGTIQQLFNVSGAGTIFGLRYNQNLNRIDNYEHKIIYGLDYKAFKNNVTFISSTAPLVPDVTIHPVSVTYSGLWRGATSQLDFYASYSQNVFPGGNDGANSDFQERQPGFVNPARAEAKAGYNIIRGGANYTQQLWGEWQARTVFAIQQTDAALIAGEQFGAGGADSVRGFDERYVSNDRGWRANFELYTPDIAGNLGWKGGRVKLLGFIDTADLTRNRRQPGEAGGTSISSYGLGLRLQTKNVFSMRVDYAQVYHDGESENLAPRFLKDGRRNSNTVHASMLWVF
jgi:hemolysin activation/secretion protein